ncbi:hypothetical protein BS17DRAFT_786895, partial [Gyrodon lividus]
MSALSPNVGLHGVGPPSHLRPQASVVETKSCYRRSPSVGCHMQEKGTRMSSRSHGKAVWLSERHDTELDGFQV